MRLIDADKLKEYIDDCECCKKCDKIGFMCNDDCELPDFLTPQWERVLNEQPTVDAQLVRHGKWINFEHGDDKYYCDKCQTIWESKQIKNMHYCPTCGAKMEAEQDE